MEANQLFQLIADHLPDGDAFIDIHLYRGGMGFTMSVPGDEGDGEFADNCIEDGERALLEALAVTKGEA